MVGRVLTGNGITRYGDGCDALLQLCRQRLESFLADGDPGLDADQVLDALGQTL